MTKPSAIISPYSTLPDRSSVSKAGGKKIGTQSPSSADIAKDKRKLRILAAVTIIGSMIGVCLTSWLVLIHKSLRLDESQSIWQSSHSFSGMLHAVALDVHVPLYHIILHFWLFFFGQNVTSIRLLSLFFFLATIPVVYLLSRQLLSAKWSMFATILFSFSPFMNWYANEARMYTLLVLMATLSQYFFVRIIKTGKGWGWYALIAVLGAYSHYFFMFNLAAQGIFYLFNRRLFARGTLLKFIAVAVAVVVALSPWLLYFHSLGSASDTRPLLQKPSTVDFFNAYSQFIFGFQNDRINTYLLSSWPLVMLVALAAVRRGKMALSTIGFIAAMATIPIVLAYIVSLLVTPFFLSRYMISSMPALIILIVWIISQYGRKAASAFVTVALIATILTSVQQAYSASTPLAEDYKGIATRLNKEAAPQDLIVLSAPFTIYPFEYYYHGEAQIQTIPVWDRVSPGAIPAFSAKDLPKIVAAQNAHHRYIYLMLSQDQGYEKTISDYYLTHFKQVSHKTYSDDLTLYVYQVGFYSVPAL